MIMIFADCNDNQELYLQVLAVVRLVLRDTSHCEGTADLLILQAQKEAILNAMVYTGVEEYSVPRFVSMFLSHLRSTFREERSLVQFHKLYFHLYLLKFTTSEFDTFREAYALQSTPTFLIEVLNYLLAPKTLLFVKSGGVKKSKRGLHERQTPVVDIKSIQNIASSITFGFQQITLYLLNHPRHIAGMVDAGLLLVILRSASLFHAVDLRDHFSSKLKREMTSMLARTLQIMLPYTSFKDVLRVLRTKARDMLLDGVQENLSVVRGTIFFEMWHTFMREVAPTDDSKRQMVKGFFQAFLTMQCSNPEVDVIISLSNSLFLIRTISTAVF
ncbi:hypothetical protein VKT23_015900 [Stygiomarasmius scandens]|uniref:Uncharacterized protein n=1 Tax=Marasmiellus scandens TaxID=2682957 RepID=A0ABR1IXU5_9AGAR